VEIGFEIRRANENIFTDCYVGYADTAIHLTEPQPTLGYTNSFYNMTMEVNGSGFRNNQEDTLIVGGYCELSSPCIDNQSNADGLFNIGNNFDITWDSEYTGGTWETSVVMPIGGNIWGHLKETAVNAARRYYVVADGAVDFRTPHLMVTGSGNDSLVPYLPDTPIYAAKRATNSQASTSYLHPLAARSFYINSDTGTYWNKWYKIQTVTQGNPYFNGGEAIIYGALEADGGG